MKYKKGDRVRIAKFHDKKVIGQTGKIVKCLSIGSFDYSLKWDKIPKHYFPQTVVDEKEIELCVQIGEQLLFDFMKGE